MAARKSSAEPMSFTATWGVAEVGAAVGTAVVVIE
jgi:hypothetical protein